MTATGTAKIKPDKNGRNQGIAAGFSTASHAKIALPNVVGAHRCRPAVRKAGGHVEERREAGVGS